VIRVPHAERLAIRECLLRGAAHNYAEACGASDEDASAAELREAAIGYAAALLQHAGSEASRTGAPKRPRRRNPSNTEIP
jgi:hypothetical protein